MEALEADVHKPESSSKVSPTLAGSRRELQKDLGAGFPPG